MGQANIHLLILHSLIDSVMENYPFNTYNMLLATYTCSQNGSSASVDLYISVRRMKLFLGKQITLPFLPEQNRRNIWRQPFAFEMFARPSFFFRTAS